ncbi:4-hydroxy-3-methylbut-2-enyl diphosphate reductase [Acidihalobacter ferrooxydans]|nr:4-hydroxy-3-methylbut-2-enyl diphosphate reductase [Acidihalobacter ferrooxydans]
MEVVLANPRGFCAGVIRAVEIVERALDAYGAPVYVVHEIVHNEHVVKGLRERGAVFVDHVAEVPDGATMIFSAHGVAAAVSKHAQSRDLRVIDATCPLVTKVHVEVAQHAKQGREVVLIGHAGHPEVIGTMGQYDTADGGAIYLVETVEDAEKLAVCDPSRLAYVTQTTLSLDDARQITEVLQRRFPAIRAPRRDDICYATQNRQVAVRELSRDIDVLLVIGAPNSSNSNRLREVGEQMGVPSYLVPSAAELDPAWVADAARVGVTAGASAPAVLVKGVLEALSRLGVEDVREMDAEHETVTFNLPQTLLRDLRAAERAENSVSQQERV